LILLSHCGAIDANRLSGTLRRNLTSETQPSMSQKFIHQSSFPQSTHTLLPHLHHPSSTTLLITLTGCRSHGLYVLPLLSSGQRSTHYFRQRSTLTCRPLSLHLHLTHFIPYLLLHYTSFQLLLCGLAVVLTGSTSTLHILHAHNPPPSLAKRFPSIPSPNATVPSNSCNCSLNSTSLAVKALLPGSPGPGVLVMVARGLHRLFPTLNANSSNLTASSLMYQTQGSTTSNMPYSNGHLSPIPTKSEDTTAITSESESDLSEAIDLPAVPTITTNGETHLDTEKIEDQGMESESSHEEDALGSDDPDFDMETPPHQNAASSRDARSSSQDSPRPRKRKVGIEQDDYYRQDPELYGLRRSVSYESSATALDADSNPGPSSSSPTICIHTCPRVLGRYTKNAYRWEMILRMMIPIQTFGVGHHVNDGGHRHPTKVRSH